MQLEMRGQSHSTPIEPNIVHAGNTAAHEEDAVVDPSLYRTERRSDHQIFRLLYGFTHHRGWHNPLPVQPYRLAPQKSRKIMSWGGYLLADRLYLDDFGSGNSVRGFTIE